MCSHKLSTIFSECDDTQASQKDIDSCSTNNNSELCQKANEHLSINIPSSTEEEDINQELYFILGKLP